MSVIPVITITQTQLMRSIHRIRHEHGTKWEPVDGCGCDQWAERVWDQLPIERLAMLAEDEARDAEAEAKFLKPIR